MFYNQKKDAMKKRKFIFLFFMIIAFIVLSGVVMFLWNSILPGLLNVNRINYLQSAGLLLLCRILFGSFRFGNRGGGRFGQPGHLREKWMNMSDEEKLKFREEWKKRCAERKK